MSEYSGKYLPKPMRALLFWPSDDIENMLLIERFEPTGKYLRHIRTVENYSELDDDLQPQIQYSYDTRGFNRCMLKLVAEKKFKQFSGVKGVELSLTEAAELRKQFFDESTEAPRPAANT